MSTATVGYLVSLSGILGAFSMLATGWFSDRRGDCFKPLLVALAAESIALVVIAVAPSPLAVMLAFLLGAASYTAAMQAQVTIWTNVFPVRALGVCGAAINTVLQMGNFLGPLAFGIGAIPRAAIRRGFWLYLLAAYWHLR
jgi:MFS family permease